MNETGNTMRLRWNHKHRPSVCEVLKDGKVVFSGTYADAIAIYMPQQK